MELTKAGVPKKKPGRRPGSQPGPKAITSAKSIAAAERKDLILTLRRQGLRLEQVAAKAGCSTTYVHNVVKEYLKVLRERGLIDVEALRAIENERLDQVLVMLMSELANRNATLDTKLKVIDRVHQNVDRRARINGLEQIEVKGAEPAAAPTINVILSDGSTVDETKVEAPAASPVEQG